MIRTDGDRADSEMVYKRLPPTAGVQWRGVTGPERLEHPRNAKSITQHTVSPVSRALFILFLPLSHGVGVSHFILPSPSFRPSVKSYQFICACCG